MKLKNWGIILLIIVCFPIIIAAQDSNPDVDDWEDFRSDLYARGDQTFIISLGTTFPLLFVNEGKIVSRDDEIFNYPSRVGGSLFLSYNYFLSPYIFWGGEASVQFVQAINRSSLFIIPFGARIGYQFNIGRIDIPLTAGFGMALHRFLSSGNFGIYAKGGVAPYFRVGNNWSFGIDTSWYWFPQRTNEKIKNVDGHILYTLLSARYHF